MAHHDDSHDHAAPHGPHPMVPVVCDDAPDSSPWLPVVGFSILVVFALYAGLQAQMSSRRGPNTEELVAPAEENSAEEDSAGAEGGAHPAPAAPAH